MTVESLDTPNAAPPGGHYSSAVRAGDWLVLAGQGGIDPQTGRLVEGVEEQARQTLANLAATLADCGAEMRDVARVGVFLTRIDDFGIVNRAYADAFGAHRPARTTVQVAGLPAAMLVEMDAWAYLPRR